MTDFLFFLQRSTTSGESWMDVITQTYAVFFR